MSIEQRRNKKDKINVDEISLPQMGLGARELTLEITSYCQLKCVHCYGKFDSTTSSLDTVTEKDWRRLLGEAKKLGTTNIQISGGEPTTAPYLVRLIKFAKGELKFPKVKLYTNAVSMPDEVLEAVKETDTLVKVTFFSYSPIIHDKVTTVPGSHESTSTNIKKMYNLGIRLRAGVVLTLINNGPGELERTIKHLNELGIYDVRYDNMHAVGKARDLAEENEYKALCGNCWIGKLAIDSQGYVHPCVMSRFKTLGNILEQSLAEIVANPEVMRFRKSIYHAFVINK
ncbi:radical SAM protein [Candidatus Woesearchaeota archaeon]|nr:radical SAM protein [Candidatus Woesearchaeota archaeon]